jgi:hypothetical protein
LAFFSQIREAAMKKLSLVFLFLFFASGAFAQSTLSIDKLDKTSISQAPKEVGFSTLLEGVVSDPNQEVLVMAKGPSDKGWRLFPATVDFNPEAKGRYRWRAIVQFGSQDGKGIGETHQVQAVAFDKQTVMKGLTAQAMTNAGKTEVISLKRIK